MFCRGSRSQYRDSRLHKQLKDRLLYTSLWTLMAQFCSRVLKYTPTPALLSIYSSKPEWTVTYYFTSFTQVYSSYVILLSPPQAWSPSQQAPWRALRLSRQQGPPTPPQPTTGRAQSPLPCPYLETWWTLGEWSW